MRRWAGGAAALGLAALLGWWAWPAGAPDVAAAQQAAAAAAPVQRVSAAASGAAPFNDAGLAARHAQLELARAQLRRAQESLAHYREATRYPHESRPLAEHPDQIHPFEPVRESQPLLFPGGKPAPGVRIVSTQDRVYLSGEEVVRFSVSAQDDQGRTLPLLITRAVVFDLPDPRQAAGRTPLALDFRQPLQDGVYMAEFQPARSSFANFAGTLRTQLTLNQDGRQGVLNLDVIYQPGVPADWGPITEQLADGSLDFNLALQVHQAGRYVISARVDDARGEPFALLSFNDELAEGPQTARLRVFGKLLRDAAPVMPLRLRDVQGFLLLERFPDRAMLPRRAGLVYTSARYVPAQFSDAEWNSAERDRYLAELGKDVSLAQGQVARLGGGP